MIATLSSLGLPLLNGFIGEFTILSGVYQVSLRFAGWAVIGIILGAAYLLWLYQRVMFGPVTNAANEHLADLNAREYATLVPLVLLAFWIGIYPKPLFTVLDGPVRQIVEQVNPGYYNAQGPAAVSPVASATTAFPKTLPMKVAEVGAPANQLGAHDVLKTLHPRAKSAVAKATSIAAVNVTLNPAGEKR
jgi:NADH-quinone oxidoreductase subunit M